MSGMFDDMVVREKLTAAIESSGGVRSFARLHGLSASAVSEAARGVNGVSDTIAKVLGYRRVVAYMRR